MSNRHYEVPTHLDIEDKVLLGLTVRDCSGAFRCFRVATLGKLDFDGIRSRGYSFLEEILWRLKQRGARFAETPIVTWEPYDYRTQGAEGHVA